MCSMADPTNTGNSIINITSTSNQNNTLPEVIADYADMVNLNFLNFILYLEYPRFINVVIIGDK